ncbi:putative toxin-antitoxin system toxin component, PIN family [bacterium]|nr:putative toxin-antitoxin system toxin component, PIN family [bacterium]
MKVLVDTNILVSAVFNHQTALSATLKYVNKYHQIYLTTQIIEELFDVVSRKLLNRLQTAIILLHNLNYILLDSSSAENIQTIRDATDQPIINAAIEANVDIIFTGDQDFLSLQLAQPQCLDIKGMIAIFPELQIFLPQE